MKIQGIATTSRVEVECPQKDSPLHQPGFEFRRHWRGHSHILLDSGEFAEVPHQHLLKNHALGCHRNGLHLELPIKSHGGGPGGGHSQGGVSPVAVHSKAAGKNVTKIHWPLGAFDCHMLQKLAYFHAQHHSTHLWTSR